MVYLEKNNLNELIENDKVLVDFYAEWCGPCKMMHPVLENIESSIKVIKVDIDKFPELTNEYRIMSVPTMIIFNKGKKEEEIIGFHTEEELLDIINQ